MVLDDDTTNDSRSSYVKKLKDGPEIFTLISEEERPNIQGRKDYPSSPRQVEIVPDTSAQYTKGSDEVYAPFHQDVNFTGEQDTSQSIEAIEILNDSLENRKRKPYDILDEESSPFPESKVRKYRKGRNLVVDTSEMLRSYVDQNSKGVKNTKIRHEESSEISEGNMEEFFISSPTTNRIGSQSLRSQSLRLFVQDSNESSINKVNFSEALREGLKEPTETNLGLEDSSCLHDEESKIITHLTSTQETKQLNQRTSTDLSRLPILSMSQKEEQILKQTEVDVDEKPKILELELKKFLSDGEDTHISVSPDTALYLQPYNSANVSTKNKERIGDNLQASEVSRLAPYIVHGRCYDDNESRILIETWLKKDKRAFKESNQIPRTNEKARNFIKIELPERLIENLKKACKGELESNIAPAVFQPSGDDSLPRMRFFRKCLSEYDFNHDVYYPCEPITVEEYVNLVFYDARNFFEQYRTDKEYLFKDLRAISKAGKYLIIVLSDLNKLEKSLEALENKKFKDKVESQLTGSQTGRFSGTKKKLGSLEQLSMKKFDIEQRLRFIDRLWGVKIHTVTSYAEFADSLPNLISIIGKQRMDPAIRFMRYSHINGRSGKDKTDVLRQTLHQINRMPELKANGVVSAYPTFQALFKDFRKGELKSGLDGKHLMTEAMEERLYKLFTCKNPNASIG